jgi:hypothetical protein
MAAVLSIFAPGETTPKMISTVLIFCVHHKCEAQIGVGTSSSIMRAAHSIAHRSLGVGNRDRLIRRLPCIQVREALNAAQQQHDPFDETTTKGVCIRAVVHTKFLCRCSSSCSSDHLVYSSCICRCSGKSIIKTYED